MVEVSTPDSGASDPAGHVHAVAVELAAMAQNGLHYGTDKYDLQRYERLRSIAAELLHLVDSRDVNDGVERFRRALAEESGHATPKVDVRGALFDAAGRVLLVREARDGTWTLPGGWADALDTPSEAAEREFAEEAGLKVRASKLALVHDGSRHNGHAASPWHIYKHFFTVHQVDPGEVPRAGLDGETTAVDYFDLNDLPELSERRCSAAQLRLLGDHHRDPSLPTAYD